jgi:hypothetical protein
MNCGSPDGRTAKHKKYNIDLQTITQIGLEFTLPLAQKLAKL